jgi:acetylornithine deacetylase/succinyl-diaminopimelate desuccinylase-like protein
MMTSKEFSEKFQKIKTKAFDDFFTYLRFPSISSEKKYQPDVIACCEWVMDYLKNIGFTIELWHHEGHHPVIFASNTKAGPNAPTLLIYNHYDVQPVDPLELWESPPFEPTVRNGEVYARGAQDNKGQCFYVLLALKMLAESPGGLPINIKLCIEGEEECGSDALTHLVEKKQKELKADFLAVVDVGIPNPTTPAITLGVRGIITMDVIATGTKGDLHSGSHGGLAYNPLHALVGVLAGARDAKGKITIPGFYEDVKVISDEEKKSVSWDFDADHYKGMFGSEPTGGEAGYTPLERKWARPTLEINGIAGGYAGDGFKTVIPAKAVAKVSCRLVGDQEPHKTFAMVKKYFEGAAPKGIHIEVKSHGEGGLPLRTSPNSVIVQACKKAYEEVFHTPCQMIFSGASIPITSALAKAAGATPVLIGLGLPDDAIHAPNEHFGLDRIEKGTHLMINVIENLKK